MDRSRPYVVGHVAVSLDGATGGFQPDVATFYELARTWAEDVTLTGADTILAQEIALRDAPRPGPAQGGPLLAVVDGRRRVRHWDALREVGHWSDVVALRCTSTPRAGASSVDEIVVGAARVDLAAALRALGERPGVEVVRVDSGGGLLGALLECRAGRRGESARSSLPGGPRAPAPVARAGGGPDDGGDRLHGARRPGVAPLPPRTGARPPAAMERPTWGRPRHDLPCHRLRGKSRPSLSGGRNGVQAPSAIPSRSASSHSTAGL